MNVIVKFKAMNWNDFKGKFSISGGEEEFIRKITGVPEQDDNFAVVYALNGDDVYIATISGTLKLKNLIYRVKAGVSTDYWMKLADAVRNNSFVVSVGKRFGRIVEAKITGVFTIDFNRLDDYIKEDRVVVYSELEDGIVRVGVVDDLGNVIESRSLNELIEKNYDSVDLVKVGRVCDNDDCQAYLLKSSNVDMKSVMFDSVPVTVETPVGDSIELRKVRVRMSVVLFGKDFDIEFTAMVGRVFDYFNNLRLYVRDGSFKFDGFDVYAGVMTECFTKYVLPMVDYVNSSICNDDAVKKWALGHAGELVDRVVKGLMSGRVDEEAVGELRSIVSFLKNLYYNEKMIVEYSTVRSVEELLQKSVSDNFEAVFRGMPDDLKHGVLGKRGNVDDLIEEFDYYLKNEDLPEKVRRDIEFDIGIFIRDLVNLLLYNHVY